MLRRGYARALWGVWFILWVSAFEVVDREPLQALGLAFLGFLAWLEMLRVSATGRGLQAPPPPPPPSQHYEPPHDAPPPDR